ncbi:hypothetical protein [Nocardia tengchongensis]|uniref:hypothetical protein n=1 Tax=Nocardia tengchongensis TaxID=2055889 RepID=UPI00368304BD
MNWTPPSAGAFSLSAYAYDSALGPNAIIDSMIPNVNVVQSAPAGASCTPGTTTPPTTTPPTSNTGSANSIPVIGPLLSSLFH